MRSRRPFKRKKCIQHCVNKKIERNWILKYLCLSLCAKDFAWRLSLLYEFPAQKLGRALSVYTTGAFVGAGLAFIIGGTAIAAITTSPEITLPVIGTIRSWQAAFFLVGLPGLLVAALMYTVKEPLRRFNEEAEGEIVTIKEVFAYVRARWRLFGAHFIGFSMLGVVFNGFTAWTPAFLSRSFDMPVGESGPAIGAMILVFSTTFRTCDRRF